MLPSPQGLSADDPARIALTPMHKPEVLLEMLVLIYLLHTLHTYAGSSADRPCANIKIFH
jgi:hypothetical protein